MEKKLELMSDDVIREEFIKRFTIPAGKRLGSVSSAVNHLRTMFTESKYRESFAIIFLNTQHEVIESKILFKGSLDTAAIYPREVIRSILIDYPGTKAVILAHNHPSGSHTPSRSDEKITSKLKCALDTIDVDLLDHIIVGKEFYSFADHQKL